MEADIDRINEFQMIEKNRLAKLRRDNTRLQSLVDTAYPALLVARALLAERCISNETVNKAIEEMEGEK